MSTSRTFVAGAVLTAAQVNDISQGTLGYAQAVANQTTITTVVDVTSCTTTVTVVAGRRVRITGELIAGSTVGTDIGRMSIKEGATLLQFCDAPLSIGGGSGNKFIANVILQPSAAAHTYKLTMERTVGTGSITVVAGATFPAYIHVEDVGV